jgi:hypothetical protein
MAGNSRRGSTSEIRRKRKGNKERTNNQENSKKGRKNHDSVATYSDSDVSDHEVPIETCEEQTVPRNDVTNDSGDEEGELESGEEVTTTGRTNNSERTERVRFIAKNEFMPDKSVNAEHIRSILGDRYARMDLTDRLRYKKGVETLKAQALKFMKKRINNTWILIGEKDHYLCNTIKGQQNQWANLDVTNKQEVERVCEAFWKLVQPGVSKYFNEDWEYEAQEIFMKRNCLEYSEDETLAKTKGCIAMIGGVALRSCRKKMFHKAVSGGGHGYYLSACATGVKGAGKSAKTQRRKNKLFKQEYFRRARSSKDGQPKARKLLKKLSEDTDTELDSDDGIGQSPKGNTEILKRSGRRKKGDEDDICDDIEEAEQEQSGKMVRSIS